MSYLQAKEHAKPLKPISPLHNKDIVSLMLSILTWKELCPSATGFSFKRAKGANLRH